MSMSGDSTLQSVRALEDQFAEAMSRMYVVGNDLARLRARLDHEVSPQQWVPAAEAEVPIGGPTGAVPHVAPPAAPVATGAGVPAAPAAPGTVTAPPVAHAPFAGAQPPKAPPGRPPLPATPWWQRDGLVARLLAVVGTGITLIGVAFLLALAIQMGFFGPLARVVSGTLLAAGLVIAAIIVRRRQASTAGALGLAATGIATAYLDVIAITAVYEWVPAAVGLIIAGLVAIGGLLLARAWDSELLGGIAVLGVAALAPGIAHDQMLLVGQFLLVLTLASWPAQISRRWHVLELVRIIPTATVIALLPAFAEPIGTVILLAVVLAGFVLATSLAGVKVDRIPAQTGIAVPIVAVPVLSAALGSQRATGATLMIGLTLALVVVAAVTAGRRRREGVGSDTLLLAGCCLYTAGVTSLVSAALLTDGSGWVTPALLVVCVLWAGAALALRDRTVLGATLLTCVLPLLLTAALVPYAIDRGLARQVEPAHLAAAALAVVLLLLLAQTLAKVHPRVTVAVRALLAGALLGAGGAVIIAGALVGSLAEDPQGGFTAGQTGATVLWLSTAAVLLLRGLRGSAVAVPAGLAITALSVGKLLFFDLSFLDGVPRVLSFIVGGLIVLGMGAGYAQALERSRREPGAVDNSESDPRDAHTV
ncbi:DUF2339 domain-containing protein [Janibacter cremeus]|uniref:Putative membrane protein n=1 Tax=Janibacter cremeus TaxID=1285192 RepID=A0A852VP00_9MICO|nr:DUF2339 domain-containing protein [Janibacter cremeus]NYF97856.1 putative membrane protein [Janibacter cremeus]